MADGPNESTGLEALSIRCLGGYGQRPKGPCQNGQGIRGLCGTCYGRTRRAINERQTTWPKMIAAGRALRATTTAERSQALKEHQHVRR
jgi:hypothetical protein